MNIVFFGSPAAALPSLAALLEAGHSVRLVVTQPDRPAGRGRKPAASAVKAFAVERGIPIIEPARIRTDEAALERIRAAGPGRQRRRGLRPDHPARRPLFAPSPFRQRPLLAPPEVPGGRARPMDRPQRRCRDRRDHHRARRPDGRGRYPGPGAGPRRASGDRCGPRRPPGRSWAPLSSSRPSAASIACHISSRKRAQATLAPKIRKEDGRVSWADTAAAIDRKVLALGDKPGVFTAHKGKRVNIVRGRAGGSAGCPSPDAAAVATGTVLGIGKAGLEVACGAATSYLIEELQPEGKGVMSAHAFSLGTKITPGDIFGMKSHFLIFPSLSRQRWVLPRRSPSVEGGPASGGNLDDGSRGAGELEAMPEQGREREGYSSRRKFRGSTRLPSLKTS